MLLIIAPPAPEHYCTSVSLSASTAGLIHLLWVWSTGRGFLRNPSHPYVVPFWKNGQKRRKLQIETGAPLLANCAGEVGGGGWSLFQTIPPVKQGTEGQFRPCVVPTSCPVLNPCSLSASFESFVSFLYVLVFAFWMPGSLRSSCVSGFDGPRWTAVEV